MIAKNQYPVIARIRIFPRLLAACPSFSTKWQDFLLDYEDDIHEDDLPLTIVLNDFAQHLILQLNSGQTTEFPAIFDVFEQLYSDDIDYIKNIITTGFMESIQNTADPDLFLPYLKPETLRHWNALNAFWNGEQTSLTPE